MKKIYTYLIISFILFPIGVFAECVRENWNCTSTVDGIVQRDDDDNQNLFGSYNNMEIHFLARQKSGTNVYCIKKGATIPATWSADNACDASIKINENDTTNEKLKAAIGYIIFHSEIYKNAVFDESDSTTEFKNSYMRTQYLIHKLLAEKNKGKGSFNVPLSGIEADIYNAALNEFNNYKSQKVKIDKVTINSGEDNYKITAYITVENLTSNGTYLLKEGDKELKKGNFDKSDKKIEISINKSEITKLEEVELIISYSEDFRIARFKSCGDGKQPIAESTVDTDTSTIKDSAKIYPAVNIYHLTYAGVDKGNYDGNDDYYVQESSTLGMYEVGSTVTVPANEEKEYTGYHLDYIGTNLGGTIDYTAVSPGGTFTMPDRNCRLEYVYSPNINYDAYITHWKYVGDGNGNNGGVNNCLSQDDDTELLGTYAVGSDQTIPSNKEKNYPGYYFRYIGTHIGGTIDYTAVSPGDTFKMPATNFHLDYVYYPKFNITYHGNGAYDSAGQSIITDIAYYAEPYNVKNGNIFNKRDYVFDGWTTKSDGTADEYGWEPGLIDWTFLNGQRGIVDFTLNLYARWKDRCIDEFEDDIKKRIELFNSLETKRKNLLNFELHTAEEACEYYEPDYNPGTSCLETDQVDDSIEDDFDSENLSDFNDVIVNNTKISYCLTDFELELKLGINFNNPVKAGRLVLESNKDEDAIISTLTKTCYIHKDDIDNYKSNGEINESLFDNLYSDNIEGIYLDGKKLEVNINDPDITSYLDGEFYKVTATIDAQYKFNEVSAYKINGKECVSPNNECSLIGYGVLSKFVDAKNSNKGSFDFQINKGPNSVFNFKNNETIACTYTVEPEIIKYNSNDNGKLNLEFRTIDTNNPFNRTPKSNWNDGSDKSDSSNGIISHYILNAPNSYGLKNGQKQTPKYKITLTPDTIKAIRNYNKNKSYDNYEVCVDSGTNNCQSNNKFINEYIGKNVIAK